MLGLPSAALGQLAAVIVESVPKGKKRVPSIVSLAYQLPRARFSGLEVERVWTA